MLQITDLTYRIAGKLILDKASVTVPAGHKVGIVGRNGAGKTTLYKLILGELESDDGNIRIQKNARIGQVAQEAPGGPETLLETVLAADKELNALHSEAETCDDPHRIAEIHERLQDIGAYDAEARAASILSGLGFNDDAQRRACSEFSGGWRMRVALACTLFTRPDLLLLDEPTNYLDLEGVLWLENFIRNYPYTILIISHDRDLLNSSTSSIVHLEQRSLSFYGGNFDKFEKTYREQRELQRAAIKKQTAEREHIQKYIDRFRYKASKAKQAQSRIKMLEKMEPLAALAEEHTVQFNFPNPTELAPPLINMEKAAVGYEDGKPILRNLNLRIDMDDRIALLGQNGNGKSTFAKLISGRLDAMDGTVKSSRKLGIGYFAQHQQDELDPNGTPLTHLAQLMKGKTTTQVRARLGGFGFGEDKADNKIATLSGGEKARLLFALMSFHAPQMIILDEPTNHLDMDSRQALIHAINDYEGAVILISHDSYLVEACADRIMVVENGGVNPFDGDINDYKKLVLTNKGANTKKEKKEKPAKPPKKADDVHLKKLKTELDATETEVERLTAEIKKYNRALNNPKLYDQADPNAAKALQKFTKEKADLEKALEIAEERWMELEDKINA
ncbi:ABC-F family ATP-binding cassette domain-containing protein [Pseudemcibacter aquimaris]|uniref:ABC-F family ATP-binding cassette domain-containing protein n=1 Tax=Pseudemcibacter aquimaris TaxID=2857064 RepID=UPI0020117824|nr:ABC-F family ATP-binding cassette domain-containing protein [Pseudemcibacter aquimaris]MCC3859955.1 ABC-F family ATP-binding cassette domain-containing protein [Pseudemcibacter aquimaris]WDU57287.1 ABC-F family ATP-binding cassette domain-containing protein [Pseudemcibacter aquimaris]